MACLNVFCEYTLKGGAVSQYETTFTVSDIYHAITQPSLTHKSVISPRRWWGEAYFAYPSHQVEDDLGDTDHFNHSILH